ncbi:MAG: MarR family transcriptional regulator [Thermincola ferriacetica]
MVKYNQHTDNQHTEFIQIMMGELALFDIENSLGFLLAKSHKKAFNEFKTRLEPYNLTPPQFAAMAFLWKKDGINQIQLGELMDADRTTIGGIVDRLERMGLIERAINPVDRRASILFVTDKGRSMQEKLEFIAAEFNNWLGRKFSEEELVDLKAKLKKIRYI